MDNRRRNKKSKAKENTYNCALCQEDREDNVVACDICNKWYHFQCVNIVSIGKKDRWICPSCITPENPLTTSSPNVQTNAAAILKEATPPEQSSNVQNVEQMASNVQENIATGLNQDNAAVILPNVPHKERTNVPQTVHPMDRSNSMPMWMLHRQLFPQHSTHDQQVQRDQTPLNQSLRQSDISRLNDLKTPSGYLTETKSSSRRRQIQLQLLEEERELERKYLQKKYQVLLQDCDDSKTHTSRSKYTKDWVESSGRRVCIWNDQQEKDRFIDKLKQARVETSSPVEADVNVEKNNPEDYFEIQKELWDHWEKLQQARKKNVHLKEQFKQNKNLDQQNIFSERVNQALTEVTPAANDVHLGISNQQKVMESQYETYQQIKNPRQTINNFKPFNQQCTEDSYGFDNSKFPSNTKKETQPKSSSQPDDQFQQKESFPKFGQQHSSFMPFVRDRNIHISQKSQTGNNSVLTAQQIASRHVVTRDLPIFTGNPEDWPLFLSRLKNSTKLCGYNDAENLDRLQKCIKGNAKIAVKSLLLSPESVSEIVETLRMLYGRPELIINSLLKKLRQQPPPKADKLNTLVDFALAVRNVTATIEQAELTTHLGNPLLMQELVERLPTNIKIEWARYKLNLSDVTLATLGDWLYSLAQTISTVTEPTVQNFSEQKKDRKNKSDSEHVNIHQNYKSGNVESTTNNYSHTKTSRACLICGQKCQHLSECAMFKSYKPDQRWQEIRTHKLCRKCLRLHQGYCKASKDCGVNDCILKHHSLLHDEQKHANWKSKKANETKEEPKADPELNEPSAVVKARLNIHHDPLPNVLLRIVPVILYNNQRSLHDYAYLDEGSTGTLIEQEVADELELKGHPEQLCLLWTGDIHRIEKDSIHVDLEISGQNEFSSRYVMNGVRTVKDLQLPTQSLNKKNIFEKFSYLQGTPLIDYVKVRPRILIGSNNAKLCSQLELVEGGFCEPVAARSRIGWSLHGPTCNTTGSNRELLNIHHCTICERQEHKDDELFSIVKEHFAIENFGVQVNNALNICSKENERALNILKNTTKRLKKGFETGLLWRYDRFELPDSYKMAKRRLICLENKNPSIINVIDEKINEYIKKGYVSKLTRQEALEEHDHIWYLPTFAVTYPKKPDKHRMVFDAAAKADRISLNDLLLTGPAQLSSLVDILRRFREKKIAICGDIKEMFHQVKIRDQDKHVQRFLWRNGDTSKEPDTYVLNVMTFGATCSPSSAQYIKNLNAVEFQDQYPRAVKAIIENHYVDDMMECEDTEEKAIQLVKDVQKIHAAGGFDIGKFLSNSRVVLDALGESSSNESKNLSMDPENIERVLGMFWNTKKDCFTFSTKFTKINADVASGRRYPTKREILTTLMSIYDPLGLLSHYLVLLKILLQRIWRSKLGWDEEISDNQLKAGWDDWLKLLMRVEDVQIPRLYSTKLSSDTLKSLELHIFVDASEEAFAAVVYIRLEDDDGVECALVGSKARVAPIKYLSIPRMELQSAVLGARLNRSINAAQTFKVNRIQFWSDSATVLSWIRSDHRKYHQFVAHRVGEILEISDVRQWRWVPRKHNVADEATKWAKSPSFEPTSRWFQGPDFLRLPESEWPKEKLSDHNETTEEMKLHCIHSELVIPQVIDPKNFSNWNRMVRGLAYALRFIKIVRARIKKEKLQSSNLSQDELIKSRNLIFRQAQNDGYIQEMIILRRNQNLSTSDQISIGKRSVLFNCSPYLDEHGVIRVKGRIDGAKDILFDTKRPIILPRKHKITNLLVACYHGNYHHRNHETVVNEVRQRFYIPRLRIVLKSVRKKCQMCKVRNAKPAIPEMGNLPTGRLAVGFRPFSYTGLDFFGPIKVKVGRSVVKRWALLFTCLTIRAVHVEIAHSMDTESCIMCIENFITLRGQVKEFYSDNGSNFIGADNELTRAMKEALKNVDFKQFEEKFTNYYTKWNFNPPESPHMGGSWERLIRTIKDNLYSILPARNPTDEMLRNLLMEVANVVNSRPLTFIPLDSEEDEALTPNHFLLGSSNGTKPPGDFEASGSYLKSSWREIQRLTILFWQRFTKEYMPTLTRRTKWFEPVPTLQPGDIVLILEDNAPRNTYERARILEVNIGSNGQARSALVQKGNASRSISTRPAKRLAKLDVLRPEDSKSLPDKSMTQRPQTEQIVFGVPSKETSGLAATSRDSETGGSVKNANESQHTTPPLDTVKHTTKPTRFQPTRRAKRQTKC